MGEELHRFLPGSHRFLPGSWLVAWDKIRQCPMLGSERAGSRAQGAFDGSPD